MRKRATGAVTRVLLDSSVADGTWSRSGVSENIIEASSKGLVDSVVVGLVRAACRKAPHEATASSPSIGVGDGAATITEGE